MAYKTINLDPQTYERLVYYKHGNMTFNDVINEFMDMMSEEKFYMKVLKEHRRTIKEMKKGSYVSQSEIDQILD